MKTIHVSGKRKRAVARATLRSGSGKVRINKVALSQFQPEALRLKLSEPLVLAGDIISGVDIDIIKGNNSVELTEQAPSIQKFAKHVDKSWEDYTGYIGKYGRIPFEALVDIAGQAKSSNENIGKSDMEEVEKWSKLLIDSNSDYFIARAKHKGTLLQVLINTKN